MPRSIHGLAAAMEWTAFRALLPNLRDKRVLDLGCGFGWHCRYAHEHGAAKVVGIDLSEKMLERARATTDAPGIKYLRCAIEDIDFPANEFDIVMSSLALHYVESFDRVCCRIHHCLTPKAYSFSRSNTRYSPPCQLRTGTTARTANVSIGRSITTKEKAAAKPIG